MGAYGSEISKRYSSYKSQPNVSKLVLNFSPNGAHKNALGFFETLSYWFLTIFIEKFAIVAYGEIKNLDYVKNERS